MLPSPVLQFPNRDWQYHCFVPTKALFMSRGIWQFFALLLGAYAVVAYLGQDVGRQGSQPVDLTADWRFVPDALLGTDAAAFDSLAVPTDAHPGAAWRVHPTLRGLGAATFQRVWTAPDTVHTYGLRVPPFYGAYRVYFDGHRVGGRGTPAVDARAQTDFVASEVLALPRKPSVVITFEAATHGVFPGGATGPLVVDHYAPLQSTADRVVALTLFVIGLLSAIGFTVMAAAYGSPVSRPQRAFGALVVAVAGFVAFNDTGLLAAQWLIVPYGVTHRVEAVFLFGSMALVWIYAAEAGGARAFPRLRRGLVYAMIACAALAVLLPVAWSSRLMPLALIPMSVGCAIVLGEALVARDWSVSSVALARTSLLALAAGVGVASVTELGVDQMRGLLTLLCFLTFGVVGAAQFIRQLVAEQGSLIAEASAGEMKSQFMARVSHELRTPLHGISGLSKMIRDDGTLSQNQLKYLDALETSTTAMDVTVAGILDYEDVRAGRLRLKERTVGLAEVLAEALATGSLRLPEGMLIGLRNHAGVESFRVDGRRLRDALVQLLDNAVKHGSGTHPMVHVTRDGDDLEIMVRSGGATLNPEEVRAAFAAFSQRSDYWKREQGGLGIGLSMARATVEQMGGHLRHVPLENGNGFVLTVPLKEVVDEPGCQVHGFEVLRETSAPADYPRRDASAELAAEALSAEAAVGRIPAALKPARTHILVVEDHPINQLLARKMIESWGFTAEVSANGQDAIDIIAPGKFDLILMDLQMPVLDGISATRKLRELYPADVLPIVALTANSSAEDREACAMVGMQDFLSKPFKADELKAVVEALLGKGQFVGV